MKDYKKIGELIEIAFLQGCISCGSKNTDISCFYNDADDSDYCHIPVCNKCLKNKKNEFLVFQRLNALGKAHLYTDWK